MTCAISPMLYSWLLRQFDSWADTHHEWANNHCGQDEVCVRACVYMCGCASSSQPSSTHRFRRCCYFSTVSSCVLGAKMAIITPLLGFLLVELYL